MAKYYVRSGDLRTVIDGPTSMAALIEAFRSRAGTCARLSSLTTISETGFDEGHPETKFYPTARLLFLAGIEDEFQTEPPDDTD